MKILLMDPPWYRFQQNANQPYASLGLTYCAAMVREQHDVVVYNPDLTPAGELNQYDVEMDGYQDYLAASKDPGHEVWEEVRDVIADFAPDVVGIQARTASFPAAVQAASVAKAIRPDVLTVVGGPHPTLVPSDLGHPGIDVFVHGEGEITFQELVAAHAAGAPLRDVPGLAWKAPDGSIHTGPPRANYPTLDALPFPAKDRILFDELMESDGYCTLMFSRGCPYRCTFCSSPQVWSRKVRWRSPENMVAEMVHTQRTWGTEFFSFQDDTFTTNRKLVHALCDQIMARSWDGAFRWVCNTRPELLDDELVGHMKAAGCRAIAIGVESGNDEVLKQMKKGFTADDVRRAADILRRHDVVLSSQFMIGLPYESPEQMWDTVKLMEEISPVSVMLSVATPLPGTELHAQAKALGYIGDDPDWTTVTTKNDGMLFRRDIPPDEVTRTIQEIRARFDAQQRAKAEEKYRYRKLKPGYGFGNDRPPAEEQ
ncbi:MAG: radical SAM protein [bacterium]|nr:radical SAM protein [bacterium]